MNRRTLLSRLLSLWCLLTEHRFPSTRESWRQIAGSGTATLECQRCGRWYIINPRAWRIISPTSPPTVTFDGKPLPITGFSLNIENDLAGLDVTR